MAALTAAHRRAQDDLFGAPVSSVTPPPHFQWGVDTDDGRRIVSERTQMLAASARAGARKLASTKDGSKAWVAGANAWLGSRQALRGDRAALVKIEAGARADEAAPGNQAAVAQSAWAQARIADIDQALRTTSLAHKGQRDPDLIHPGEKIVLRIKPTAPHVVTPTEAKLTVLALAGRQAPHVAHDAASIDDPMRTLAAKDPVSYAAASLAKQHAGDPAWTSALAQGLPAARREWTTARVAQQLHQGDMNGALDTLKVNLDATGSAHERAQLFNVAGKTQFSQAFVDAQLNGALHPPKSADSYLWGTSRTALAVPAANAVGKLLSSFGTNAPPEVAKMMAQTVQPLLADPAGILMTGLRSRGNSANGTLYLGLSQLTQRADENGGHATTDAARTISRNFYVGQAAIDGRGGIDASLRQGAQQATELGAPALSVAIIDQSAAGNARLATLQGALRMSVTAGVRDFGKRMAADSDAYTAADKERVNLQDVYAPLMGSNRAAQVIAADRSAHPTDARAADAAYDVVRNDGLATERMLDALKGLRDGTAAQSAALDGTLDTLDANPAARYSLSVAAGDNATNHPEDAYDAPLQTYLRNQVELGLAASPMPPAADAPEKAANTIRTPLQAVGNQTSVDRHVVGLYSISGEALLGMQAGGKLLTSGALSGVLPKPLHGKGISAHEMAAALNSIDEVKLRRYAALMDADPDLATALLKHLQATLPSVAGAYQAGDKVAFRKALYKLVQGYPDLGGAYPNLTTRTSERFSTTSIKGSRTLFAVVSAINNGVNAHKDTGLDRASDVAFAATLGSWGIDGMAKTVRAARNDSVGTGFIVQALAGSAPEDLGNLRFAAKLFASVMPGEAISAADGLWLVDSVKDFGWSDLRTQAVAGMVGTNTTALGLQVAQSYARRRAAAATADAVGELGERQAAVLLLGEEFPATAPVGTVGAIAFGSLYYASAYLASKSTLEAGKDPRYAAMVGQVTGLDAAQSKAFMDQSGGAFSGPSPLPAWLRAPYVDRPAAKIVGGGVQPMDVLSQWSASRPGKEGDVQAWLPTLDPTQLSTVAHIVGGIADHDIPRGSSTVSAKGLAVLEQRLKAARVVTCDAATGSPSGPASRFNNGAAPQQCSTTGLWSPILDQSRTVVDTPVAAPATPSYPAPQPIVTTHVVKKGDTLWDLFGGRAGLDDGYRDDLPAFDRALENGKF